ncbi:lipopolysaccharide-induced tumor necrosis factor-alpha factor homolog [Macrosteles quadrilineatus]|uniref:lipopolysaccharide-induced tumor necrosis factor-alpha factor homolog n=1 Tax=Macrosteles quadrilineatus TaxID=74068 RepID=UPI0023E0D308|nr:lipopolysaccharide-induced tumor necrosis factor-alpha factor homolog [Macrosteles quadrilineatus]XP_054268265.1 lipopolysaccharide-induced tumor necrosis factor-alpha factor homolog [Macrosteles quadrilineatus]XP_054268624.1 lipopolysaccharide-induced tumor necrosis factor-alpha factor homolog [Macrosteles quadrilineatus]XP_054289908.1 lipopolysaccharide-induced tumor necrosis factor-alpha factor homolog [Macrosteles quadrilineatus]
MANKNAPPPYGFSPQGTNIVYSTQPTVMVMPMGPQSGTVTCPSCHATVSSRVEKEATTKTHLFALILCLVFCPCAIIPYCTDTCKATNHYCPSCGAFLGSYDN